MYNPGLCLLVRIYLILCLTDSCEDEEDWCDRYYGNCHYDFVKEKCPETCNEC